MTDALVLSSACASGDHHLCRPDRDRCDCDALRCATTHVLNVASSASTGSGVSADAELGAVGLPVRGSAGSAAVPPPAIARSSSVGGSPASSAGVERGVARTTPSRSGSEVTAAEPGHSTSQQRDEAGAATPAHVEERGRLHDRRTENAMPVNVLLEDEVAPGFTGRDPDCVRYLEDPTHVCHNRDGQLVRVGQACWTDARSQVLRRDDEPMCGNCFGTGLLPMPGGGRGAVRCGCRAGRVRHAS